MLIVKIEPNENGAHTLEEQSHRTAVWMDGYIEVPDRLREALFSCLGHCSLVIEGGVLADIVPGEVPEMEPTETPPTQNTSDIEARLMEAYREGVNSVE